MELKFIQTILPPYQIVVIGGKRYLVDKKTMTPKSYLWGVLPNNVEVEILELLTDNSPFESKQKMSIGTTAIVLAVQPLVKVGYDLMKSIFIQYDVSAQVLVKVILFVISILISYFLYFYYLRNMDKKVKILQGDRVRRSRLVFKVSGKRNLSWYVFIIIILICVGFFMGNSNGTEGVFLVINSLLSFVAFIFSLGVIPIDVFYNNQQLIFDRIEEDK